MRRCFHVATIALGLGLAVDAFAAGRPMNPTKESIAPDAGDVHVPLAIILNTGFEAPFVAGALEPQQGWTASGVNLPWASISGVHPFAGSQHVRIVRDVSVGSGINRVLLGPLFAQAPATPNQTKVMVHISNDQGADYDVIGQSPAQGLVAWRVKFHYTDNAGTGPGTIFVLDNPGTGAVFMDTGVAWTEGAYRELKVQFEPAADEIRYFYDGVLIWTTSIYAATSVDQFVALADNWQLANEHAGLDNLNMLDTPSDPVPAASTTWGRVKGQYR